MKLPSLGRRATRRSRLLVETLEGRTVPAALSNFLTTPHVDLNIGLSGGTWSLQPRDDEAGASFAPDDALLVLGTEAANAAQTRSASSDFAFIGVPAGATYYRLPSSQDPELLYLGFAGYGVSASAIDRYNPSTESKGRASGLGRWLKVSLTDVKYTDPDGVVGTGGKFSVWQSGDTSPVVLMSNTNDGVSNSDGNGLDTTDGISADDALWVVAGGHTHFNWGFTQKGRYEVTVKVSGYLGDDGLSTPNSGGFSESQSFTLYFSVGNIGQVQLSAANVDVAENAGTATVTVNRTGGSDGRITVNYATSNGTATVGQDYNAASGTLTFNDQETSKTFTIPITNDSAQEGNETINVMLSNPGPASIAGYTAGLPAGGLLGTPTTGTVTILANDTPTPPTISDVSNQMTDEDTPITVNYTVGDADTPAGQLVLSATSNNTTLVPNNAAHLTFGGAGANRTLTVTPASNASGTTTITVVVTDGSGLTATDTFVLTVNAVNDAPVATPQNVSTDEDAAKAITLSGTDAENAPLTYAVVTGPAHGTLTGTAPNLTYTPDANYNGLDSFTFKVNDGSLDSAVATVSIAVAAVNDPPVANGQSVSTDEDTAKAITLTGSDIENSTLSYVIVSGPAHGTLTGSGANRTYTPDANYNGPDSFTFKVNDGSADSGTATVSITINAVDDAPVAIPQNVSTNEDAAKAITLSGTDAENAPLTYAVVTGPAHGTLTGTAPNLTYTPDANYNGLDSFTFEVNDGSLDSAVATVSIAVAAVNDPPVPGDDDFGLTPGNVLHGTVLANDTDVDGDALTAVVATGPSAGSLSLSLNGSFTYTPGVAFAGSDTFTYTASDGHGGTATATVSITARPANPTFTATLSEGHVDIGLAYEADAFDPHVHDEEADEEYAPEDALLEVRREALTTRPAGTAFDFLGVPAGTLYWRLPQSQNPELLFLGFGTEELEEGLFADEEVSFQLIGVDGPGQFAVWLSTDTGPDVLMSTADGVAGDASILLAGGHEHVNWGFTAAGLYGVTLRPIGTLVDGKVVNVDPVTYYFQVEPNAAPASTDDAFGVTPGNVLRGNVLGNDSDADGDVLTATLGSAPTHGTIQFAADGSFTYTPGATFAGTDSFTYTVSDGIAGGTVTATVTITGRPAEPGFEAVLSEGHVDVGIAYEDDAFDPHIHDEVHDIEYEPGEAAYHVRPGALTTRPDSATFDFIGVPAGAQYYRLPQTQDPTLLYLGFGAEELEDGVFQNDQVFVTLVAVDGPGQFSVWENTDSGPDVVFATSDGITDADIAPVIAASHFHVNWAFSQRGIYAVTVRLSGTLVDGTPVTSEDATYYFVVDPANAAPVQTAPAAVTTIQDVPVALTGTNAVSIADSDSTGTFTVELAATNGTVSIPVTPGVTFTTGYGVDDATLVMSGSKDDLNAALAGLTFTPAAGFVGAASLSISTTDSGVLVGDENAETDSDTISVTVSLPTVSVARVADAAEPGTAGAVRFTRTGSLSQSLVVNYTVGGTATPEDDYTPLSGMVTFGIGVASVEVPVTPVDDDEIEETETVIVTITPAAAFTVGGGPATVNVVNDDEIKLDSIVIGSGAGGMVRVVNQTGADVRPPIQPYGATFTGGVRVASADVTGDGVNDIITGAGPGAGPHVKVYDGVTGAEVASFFAFEPTFRGGVFVAAGDLDGDGRAEVFASPDVSGGPRVVVFAIDGGTVTQRASFFGIDDAGFRGGVRIAVGDVNGDLVPDLVVAAGFGGGPRIAIFDGASLQTTPTRLLSDYFVFEQNLRNGAFVALGDATDDGRADLLFGAGPGGSPRVLGLDAAAMLAGRAPVFVNLFAGNSNSRAGVRVAAVDVDGDGRSELVTGAADGSGRVSVYTLSGGAATLKDEFDAFADLGGVFVG